MRSTWFLAAGLLLSTSAHAQDQSLRRSCGGTFNLCGYENADRTIVIPQIFERATPFKDGLAAVRISGLWGVIDMSGKVVIEPRFEAVGNFSANRAEFVQNGRSGVIDRTGNIIIPPRFGRVIPFTDDVFLATEDAKGHALRIGTEDYLPFVKGLRLFHRSSGWLGETPLEFSWFNRESNLIWAKQQELFGLLNDRNEWVAEPQFRHVQALMNGLAVVSGPGEHSWGAVDATGKIVVPLKYHSLSYFDQGYALLGGAGDYQTRKVGLIRRDGVVVAEPVYDKAERPDGKNGPRVQKGGIWYDVDASGALTPVPPGGPDGLNLPDGRIVASCPQGLRIRSKGAEFLIENADGKPAFDEPASHVAFGILSDHNSLSGDQLHSRNLDCSAPIDISFDGYERSTFVRQDGTPLFNPPRFFGGTMRFFMGHAIVNTGRNRSGETGVINANGEFTIPLSKTPISGAGSESKFVKKLVFYMGEPGGVKLVDANGKPTPDAEKAIETARRARAVTCRGGLRVTRDNDRFGLSDAEGKVIIPAVHRAISCFYGGVAYAPRDDLKKWCPLGPDGKPRAAPPCRDEFYPVLITHHYPEKFSEDRYESSVLWVQAGLRYGMGLRDKPPGWVGDGIQSQMSYSVAPFRP